MVDDPLFDPWTDLVPATSHERGPTVPPSKWRSPPPPPAGRSLAASRHAIDFRALIVPPLADLRQRLEVARHETTVDDRLNEADPSIRFLVQPHAGPFDEEATTGSVLEVCLESKPSHRVVGRLWMDPRAAGPAEEISIDVDVVSAAWIDALLLDFLVKTLELA